MKNAFVLAQVELFVARIGSIHSSFQLNDTHLDDFNLQNNIISHCLLFAHFQIINEVWTMIVPAGLGNIWIFKFKQNDWHIYIKIDFELDLNSNV